MTRSTRTNTRTISNPIVGDRLTFIELSSETNDQRTVVEVELQPGGSSALHYHTQVTETFEAVDGTLQIHRGKEKVYIESGQSATIEPGIVHGYANATEQEITFRVTVTPGFRGFEQFLQIVYGLAEDGLTTASGMPKRLTHTGVLLDISDTNLPGPIRIIEPLVKLAGLYARWKGSDKKLFEQYCRL
ncbi:MAG: cupin domain-containing protein [Chloroflexota bacterium]